MGVKIFILVTEHKDQGKPHRVWSPQSFLPSAEHAILSRSLRAFPQIDQALEHKANLSRIGRTVITRFILPNSGIKPENRKTTISFSDSSVDRESACSAGDLGLIPGLGRSPGEGNSCPLQCSGLENSMEYTYTVHGVAKSWTQLSDFHIPTFGN